MEGRSGLASVVLTALALSAIAACRPGAPGDKPGDTPQDGLVTITGRIVDAYTPRGAGGARSADSDITHISAIPLLSPAISVGLLGREETYPLSEDGTFRISLPTESPWLLVLKNLNAATRRDLFRGIVAVADPDETLIFLPLDAASSDIDLHDILRSDDDEYLSEMSLETFSGLFDCPISDIQLLARFDNVGKYIKNYYANHDPATGALYDMDMSYWYYSRDPIQDGVFLNPDRYQKQRYGLSCRLRNVPDIVASELIAGTATLSLRPPEGCVVSTTWTGGAYTATNPLSTASDYWEFAYFDSTDYNFDGGVSIRVSDATGDVESLSAWLTGDTPVGTWVLERDGEERAWFDLTSAREKDAAGQFTVFVPVPRFDFDDQGTLTAVEVMFVYYDRATSSYVELPDYGVLSSFIGRFNCGMRDYFAGGSSDGFHEERLVWDDAAQAPQGRVRITSFSHAWGATADPGGDRWTIDDFGVGFQYGAVYFCFGIRTDGGS